MLAVKPTGAARGPRGASGSGAARRAGGVDRRRRHDLVDRGRAAARGPSSARCRNTPAQVGEGMTVWTDATPEVSEAPALAGRGDRRGPSAGTSSSTKRGSLTWLPPSADRGPAYVFLMMEALIDAAVHLGFSRSDARELVVQTIRGAAIYAEQQPVHPAELRNRVTSPGGTSADALLPAREGELPGRVMSKAVLAAFQRSVGARRDEHAARGGRDEAVARPDGRAERPVTARASRTCRRSGARRSLRRASS